MSVNEKLYAERDIMELDRAGNYYCRHVSAMTGEGLHSKSDIAAELAYRDLLIYERDAELDQCHAKIEDLLAENKMQRESSQWISVKDGMPPDDVAVLVAFKNERNNPWDQRAYIVDVSECVGGQFGICANPTHWQPLPLPPTPDSEGVKA